ncbi:unnamed protein product [Periconia digitata]|uniref:DUF3825 domain-containing protein n=1 Tax=Periconia digitata TaxID=1303443 RepID=A0A9W4XQM5_9PLEO|nr:unnamed protein product [Periconia digitata]
MPTQATSPDFPPILTQFAYFPYSGPFLPKFESIYAAWNWVLSTLANLAEAEDWKGSNSSAAAGGYDHECPILHKYLHCTYQRLVVERNIAINENGQFSAFNTGLLDIYDQEIFGFFMKNSRSGQQPWIFIRWATESDGDLMINFEHLPSMAEYVTDVSHLVYDMRRKLVLDYAHILGDNLSRFPIELQSNPIKAKQALDAAVAQTLKRLRRNYKLAIPQWYPKLKEAGAQLLLPLDLTSSGSADVGLVVAAPNDSQYRGYTILSLEMAYTNARLVARPDSQWLKPLATAMEEQPVTESPVTGSKRERDLMEPNNDEGPLSPQARHLAVYGRR